MRLRRLAAKTVAFSLLSVAAPACKQQGSSGAKSANSPDSGVIKAGAVSEADMGGLVNLRNDFLAVNSRADLDAFITKLATTSDSLPPEAKFVATQMLLLRPMQSLTYRMTPILQSVNATHSLLLTAVQQITSTLKIFAPTPQWQAFAAYINEPYSAQTPQFKTIEEVQNDAELNVMPIIIKAIKDIESIDVTDAKPIVWDNKFIYGTGTFKDGHDRFSKIGAAEKQQVLGSLYRGLLTLRLACAYHLDDALKVSQRVGMIFGVDGYLLNSVEGAPMAARVQTLKDLASFLTLRTANADHLGDGAALLKAALGDLRAATKAATDQFAAVQARSAALAGQSDDYWGINPAAVLAYQRVTSLSLQEAAAIAAGPAQVTSVVTGETTTVNVPAFFTTPPADLKAFLPTAFVTDKTGTAQGVPVRNYLWGSPTSWNPGAYAPYLPDVKNPGDVANVARILSESRGGAGVLSAIASFVN